jgi:hypothetical protein
MNNLRVIENIAYAIVKPDAEYLKTRTLLNN